MKHRLHLLLLSLSLGLAALACGDGGGVSEASPGASDTGGSERDLQGALDEGLSDLGAEVSDLSEPNDGAGPAELGVDSGPDDLGVGDAGEADLEPADLGQEEQRFPAGRVTNEVIARRSERVQVDGLLNEWGDADAFLVAPSVVGQTGGRNWDVASDEDLSGTLALLYDSERLYLAARIRDDDEQGSGAPAGEWWLADSVSLFFDLDGGRQGSAWREGDNLFAFVADPAAPAEARWWRRGGSSGPTEQAAPASVSAVLRRTPDGYDLEAAIPISVLTENYGLRLPEQVGFTTLLTDPDGGVTQLMWVGDGDDQSRWGRLRFDEHRDGDGDGWSEETDCDDGRADTHPGAPELAGTGRDEDCDGETDEGALYPGLAALWEGRARFQVAQDPVPVANPSGGHREAFAVNRGDISPTTVYLYHRCFPRGGGSPSICLSISPDGGETFPEARGEVVGPAEGHIFAVASSVVEHGGRWVMAYEESNVAAVWWAESEDGLSWETRGQLIEHGRGEAWDRGATATPGLFTHQDGRVFLFYAGFPAGGAHMDIGYASGRSMGRLSKSPDNPVFGRSPEGWDSGQVSMPRVVEQGGVYYMIFEGADRDFTCEGYNRYGWGLARSEDLIHWSRLPANPIRRSSGGCGNDMPNPFIRSDGRVSVYHTSDDTRRIVREDLVEE